MSTQIINDRQTALSVGYRATDWREPIDEETYRMFLEDWSVQAIMRDNEPIGAVFRRGDELHLSILPAWRRRWCTRSILRELFENRITRTVLPADDHYMRDILARLGFVELPTGEFVKGH